VAHINFLGELKMQTAVRKVHFCYGHRVMNHESKCATLHGHNGIVWIHATPIIDLDNLGRVIDFSVLKEVVGGWIDTNWDHTMILFSEDKITCELVSKAPSFKKPYIMEKNPTAENLAHHLLYDICPKILKGKGVIISKITFWETENCYAEQSLDPNDPKIIEMYK
jgi:6-pyruvoyltetrahydropterin/6-carboxytetrahydropterin synthase